MPLLVVQPIPTPSQPPITNHQRSFFLCGGVEGLNAGCVHLLNFLNDCVHSADELVVLFFGFFRRGDLEMEKEKEKEKEKCRSDAIF